MTAPVERSRYWIFSEEQLDEALKAYTKRCGPLTDEAIGGIWDVLDSDEFAERGMRRGGND